MVRPLIKSHEHKHDLLVIEKRKPRVGPIKHRSAQYLRSPTLFYRNKKVVRHYNKFLLDDTHKETRVVQGWHDV